MQRRTIITFGRLAMRELRLDAARQGAHGLQVLTIEQFAERLAGGFVKVIDKDTLREAILKVLPTADLGELEAIKLLPGFVRAAADTFNKAWLAGIDLQARQGEHARIAALASLERSVLEALPNNVLRPTEIAARASGRLDFAAAIFGEVEIRGLTELFSCYRELVGALPSALPVTWRAGPRQVPAWAERADLKVERSPPERPSITCVSAATAYHEAIEAMRWARGLLASGQARPEEIAFAATACDEYDDHLLALRSDANLDLHFAHGIPVTTTRDGQAIAALADLLLRGLSRTRVHRLTRRLANSPGPFESLPPDWLQALPESAPLTKLKSWSNLIMRENIENGDWLLEILALIDRGAESAQAVGEALLTGKPLAMWRRALLLGPPASLDLSIESLRTDDGLDPGNAIVWTPASSLAAAPRPHVYLLGLNSQRWPHVAFEDRLLSSHIIPTTELEPLPVNLADTRDFETILASTANALVLSRARRDSEGRLLGRSALLQQQEQETYRRRHRTPSHAFSESDRLVARPSEFKELPQAQMAAACWRNWNNPKTMTEHDGVVRPGHPVIEAILRRTQSAHSLRLLLRNPLGFLWRYGLGFGEPQTGEEPLTLDALAMGQLVHELLEQALVTIEAGQGLVNVNEADAGRALAEALQRIADEWQLARPVPPNTIWQKSLSEATVQGMRGLLRREGEYGQYTQAYAEVPFGGAEAKSVREHPWDAKREVKIPQTNLSIRGYIDRLDLSATNSVDSVDSADGTSAWVRDYKTGKSPKVSESRPFVLDQGRELQRCLYAYAARAMLGPDLEVRASLHYLPEDVDIPLAEPDLVLESLAFFLSSARKSLQSGAGVIGAGAADAFDDFAFALPANAANLYCKTKLEAARELIGEAADIWEAG